MKKTFLIFFILFSFGCTTTSGPKPIGKNRLEQIKLTGALDDQTGVIVLSAGRNKRACKECHANWLGILPFVSYHVVEAFDNGEEMAFLPAEAGSINQMGKKHYGYIHMRELAAGKYYLVGVYSRGRNMVIAGGGFLAFVGPGSKETGIIFEFDVLPGKVNYLGSLITTDGRPYNSSISILQFPDRDLAYAYKKYPKLQDYEVVNTQPKALNRASKTDL